MSISTTGVRESITVWVVEDSSDYRGAVRDLVGSEDDLSCPHVFESGEALLEHLNDHFAPEVLLMDIGLPGMSGVEAVTRLRGISPATQIVMLTIHEDNDRIFEAIRAGASAYLSKTASQDEILAAIRDVAGGGSAMTPQVAKRVLNMLTQVRGPQWDYQLTAREKDVLEELVGGKTKAKIAESMFLSPHTIDTHIRNVYTKLHVHSRAEAVAKALREGLF